MPAAALLVALLAPWDRARLRLTCRALAAAIPAAACAPTLAAMVRPPGRGAALLRYGAGDARPHWVHVLIAAEADAADALRWLLRQVPIDQSRMRLLNGLALRTGCAAVWRVVEPLTVRPYPRNVALLVENALQGGSEPLIAEYAATAAGAVSSRDPSAEALRRRLLDALEEAGRRDVPDLVLPFLPLGDCWRAAAFAAMAMGRRGLAEPCDWLALLGPRALLRAALRGGELELARTTLRDHREAMSWSLSGYLLDAAMARRDAGALLDWFATAAGADRCWLLSMQSLMVGSAIEADAVDALRWLSGRAGFAPTDATLIVACEHDAVACIGYHLGLGIRPTADTLIAALRCGKYRVAAAVGARTEPLDVATLVRLLESVSCSEDRALRAMALLRRLALLPAPGPEFLRACTDLTPGLLAAGYRVDADARAWLDSVQPHCVGTPRRVWRPLAHAVRDRWHTQCRQP